MWFRAFRGWPTEQVNFSQSGTIFGQRCGMNTPNIHHSLLTHNRSLTRFLWLLFWVSVWVLGLALCDLIIDKLYFH